MRRPLLAVALLIAAAACGPTKDVLVGVRSDVLPITLAAPRAAGQPTPNPIPGPGPLPLPSLQLTAPSFVAGVGAPTGPPMVAVACPTPGPLTFPAEAATTIVASGAPTGAFDYRAAIAAAGQQQPSPVVEHWIVSQATDQGGGSHTFVVTEGVEGTQGATTYHYAADSGGVYLTEVDYPNGSTFKPLSKITLLQTPADPTAGSWNSAGADPLSGIAMTYTGQVTGRKHVNACGQFVDSWEVQATASIVSPSGKEDQRITYDFATQYGGLIVAEVLRNSYIGQTGNAEEDATIDEVP